MRFSRSERDPSGSSWLVHRSDVSPRLPGGDESAMFGPRHSFGDFVSRLWARFGAPHVEGPSGFTYVIHDTQTGVDFTAYAESGNVPAYGGWGDSAELRDVVTAFEAELIDTEPADCVIEYTSSTGPARSGATGGIPWDFEPVVLPKPTSPIDAADCIYIAKQHCEAPGANWWQQGWAVCLRQVLAGEAAIVEGRRGVCTAVVKGDVPIARIAIDGSEVSAPVLSVSWPEPNELVEMWLEALRTFAGQKLQTG